MPSSPASIRDYTGVTETPGTRITRDAARMAVSRYEVARRLAAGRRVLEIACGAGQGLGYVGADAAWICGGDITSGLLRQAAAHYGSRVPLVQFDAHALPFAGGAFDVVQVHEAIYYMADPETVFAEAHRVLAPGGALVISSINPAWADFNPSPHATGYLDARGLAEALGRQFARVDLRFGFPVTGTGAAGGLVSVLKRAAVRLGLVPKTMKGKRLLKRVFLGPLLPAPAELTQTLAPVDEPVDAPLDHAATFRILYAVAHR
ncbi:MAG: class I SAM-dependent methyltransferase [Vicinamibacterales bacterium]